MISLITVIAFLIVIAIGSWISICFIWRWRKSKWNIVKGIINIIVTLFITGLAFYPVKIDSCKYYTICKNGIDTDVVLYTDGIGARYLELIEDSDVTDPDRFMQEDEYYPYGYIKWRCGYINPNTVYNSFIKTN